MTLQWLFRPRCMGKAWYEKIFIEEFKSTGSREMEASGFVFDDYAKNVCPESPKHPSQMESK